MKKSGTIRIIIGLIFVSSLFYYLFKNEYINFDRTPPTIKYNNNANIFNKLDDNFLLIEDKKSNLKYIKAYFKSIDTGSEYILFYKKNLRNKQVNKYIVNLKKTKLNKYFSSNIKDFSIKIEACDDSFNSNKSTKKYFFKIDNMGPTIKVLNKSLNLIKNNSILSFKLFLKDENKIKTLLINDTKNFIIRKNKNNIYDVIYFFGYNKNINNFIKIKAVDEVNNSNTIKLYYLFNKSYNNIIKNILFSNRMLINIKNDNTDIKKEEKLFKIFKNELNEELKRIYRIMDTFKKNKYNYFKSINTTNYIHTKDKILTSSYYTNYNFVFKNNKEFIKMPSILYKINNKAFVYPISEGVIIYKEKMKILGNIIIIKHKSNIYSVYFFLKDNKNIIVGQRVNQNTPLSKPEYNIFFKSNVGFMLYYKNINVNPKYFVNKKWKNIYIDSVFNKKKED